MKKYWHEIPKKVLKKKSYFCGYIIKDICNVKLNVKKHSRQKVIKSLNKSLTNSIGNKTTQYIYVKVLAVTLLGVLVAVFETATAATGRVEPHGAHGIRHVTWRPWTNTRVTTRRSSGVFRMPCTPPAPVAKWEISQLSCGISPRHSPLLVGPTRDSEWTEFGEADRTTQRRLRQ